MAINIFPSDPSKKSNKSDQKYWRLANTCICETTKEVFGIPRNKFKRNLLRMFGINLFPAGNVARKQVLHGEFRIEEDTVVFDFPMTTKYGIMDCTLLRSEFKFNDV